MRFAFIYHANIDTKHHLHLFKQSLVHVAKMRSRVAPFELFQGEQSVIEIWCTVLLHWPIVQRFSQTTTVSFHGNVWPKPMYYHGNITTCCVCQVREVWKWIDARVGHINRSPTASAAPGWWMRRWKSYFAISHCPLCSLPLHQWSAYRAKGTKTQQNNQTCLLTGVGQLFQQQQNAIPEINPKMNDTLGYNL